MRVLLLQPGGFEGFLYFTEPVDHPLRRSPASRVRAAKRVGDELTKRHFCFRVLGGPIRSSLQKDESSSWSDSALLAQRWKLGPRGPVRVLVGVRIEGQAVPVGPVGPHHANVAEAVVGNSRAVR
jgi:hypothetical protein